MKLTLITLKKYLQARRSVSLSELERAFAEDAAFIEDLLQFFINKKQLTVQPVAISCGKKCGDCSSSHSIVYSWNYSDV